MNRLIIDGSNLLHRAHWIANSNSNLSVYHLFLSSMKKLMVDYSTSDVFCAWDTRLVYDSVSFRKEMTGHTYKGNRDRERNEEVHNNQENIARITEYLGVKNIYPGILEADDVIYWLCKYRADDKHNIIVSADQDLLQLIGDNTSVYSPIKKVLVNTDNFEEFTGVSIDSFVQFKALMGDKSDNIQGVPRCGKKTALRYIEQGVTSCLTPENLEIYNSALKLVDLSQGIKEHPGDVDLYESQYTDLQELQPDLDKFRSVCESYNLKTMITNIPTFKRLINNVDEASVIENTVNDLVKRLNLS